AAGRLVGLMSARLAPADRGDRPRAILRTLSSYATIALANVDAMAALRGAERVLARQNAELERLADTDRLTGLYNRRFLDRALQAEFATARRYGTPFSIIIIDLDHFKQVNDTWGHLAGDEVLAVTAGMIRKRARETDVVGRWGGEEFVVICPRTDRDGARAVAEAMRERVQSHEFAQAGRRTASIGTATWRAGDDAASLTHRADEALYAAKEGGRNRVVQAAA
ncbi:MAG TPA: GGDEF domain-containing protein, partial [Burkholderiaceae bacterium]